MTDESQEEHDAWVAHLLIRRWWLHVLGMVLITVIMLATYFEVHGIAVQINNGGDEWRDRLDHVQRDLEQVIKHQEARLWRLETSETDR